MVALLAVILAALMWAKRAGEGAEGGPKRRPQPVQSAAEGGGPRRRAGPRMRRHADEPAQERRAPDEVQIREEGDDDDEIEAPSGKVGKKKLEKLAAKEEKKK